MVSFAGKNSRFPAPRGGEARIQGSQSGSPIHVIPDTLRTMRHSGRGRPVRRTLETAMRGGSADPPTRNPRARQLHDEVKPVVTNPRISE